MFVAAWSAPSATMLLHHQLASPAAISVKGTPTTVTLGSPGLTSLATELS